MSGIFGNLFDLDFDGEVDGIEQGLELMFLDEILRREEKSGEDFDFDDEDDF